ncbi:MAG: UDP-N-acetylmuramoyl-L-alanine--D-glutamate ligase [Bdellovibrionales bacterium]|nr:UDP-N-acetylmuramoyl-L-alanine--D-glutamate ligase [Bdellovibrionales bacterium]
MGVTGESVLRLLKHFRVPGVITFDAKAPADYVDPDKMLSERAPRTLVVSPGVPLATPWIRDFVAEGGDVTSEIALACHLLQGERIVGVTGAVGKSTVVSLLEAGLRRFSPESFAGGNLGVPLADYALAVEQGKRPRAPWLALELSSYQLENCGSLPCEYSVLTYLTPNHMDRYASLDHYYETKWELVKRTTKGVVLNRNGGDLAKFARGRSLPGVHFFWTDHTDDSLADLHLEKARLLGQHNQDNLALAVTLAQKAGWPEVAIEGMREFPGLPHRMENLGERGGVLCVNDSKATTIESVKTAALGIFHQMDPKRQLILLLGGKDKNLPWLDLAGLRRIPKLRCVYFGEVGPHAKRQAGFDGEVFPRLEPAVRHAVGLAKPGDVILLSPGGTSLDEFKNYEERGGKFREWVLGC